jgi:cell division septation protein DedD
VQAGESHAATGMPIGTEALYRAALGPSAAREYLPVLARFEDRGRSGPVWSTRAALGNVAWLVYWRLWDAVLAQAGLTVAGVIALGWLWLRADGLPMGVRIGVSVATVLLWCALPGLWGLAWLHGGLRQRGTTAVEEADTFKEALERLERSESAWRLPGLGASAAATLAVALLAGVVWQQWRAPATPASAPPRLVQPPTANPVAVPAATPVAVPVAAPVPAPAPAITQPALAQPEPDLEPMIQRPAARPAAAPVPSLLEAPAIRPRVRGFGVNVGMFAVEANAERVQARLAEAGLPVLADPIESARGPLTRVRVGPFERREQAEAAATTVRALGLEARVYAP